MKVKVTSIYAQYQVDGVDHNVTITDGKVYVACADGNSTTFRELDFINGLVDAQRRMENE